MNYEKPKISRLRYHFNIMTQNIREELKIAAKQVSTLSQQAVEAHKAGNFQLSRTLMKDAVIAGKKCQVLLHELKKAKDSTTNL